MSYSISSEIICDGTEHLVTIKRPNGSHLSQYTQKGNLYYDFFKRRDGSEWVAIGSDGEFGIRFFNLSLGGIPYYDTGPISRYTYHNVLASPTGEYMLLVNDSDSIDFISIKGDKNICLFMSIEDKEGRWYEVEELYTFQDRKIYKAEWISNDRLIYRSGVYDLIFEMPENPIGGNVKLEWRYTTLFSLLANSQLMKK